MAGAALAALQGVGCTSSVPWSPPLCQYTFCVAGAALAALQGVGCTPWRPLVSAALPGKMELNEDQICEVFAVLERKRSWKENKLFKADIRKDRGSFIKDGTNGYPRGQAGGPPAGGVAGRNPSRQGFNRDQLKKISRCRLCQKKGHWAAECPSKKGAGGGYSFCLLKCQR